MARIGRCVALKTDVGHCLGFLNRASWLRQDQAYLTEALKNEKSRFLILDGACNPLLRREDGSTGVQDVIKNKIEGERQLQLYLRLC